jgi:hypothetical protein
LKRNGSTIATQAGTSFADTGRSPDTSYSYTIVASNSSGTSADSAAVNATTPAAPVNFVMDGTADSVGYLVAQNGMTLFAALRGSRLYVGTWSTGNNTGGANDHFVHVSDSVLASATTATPWAKAGLIAIPAGKPFLAAESTNNYVGWQNAGSATVTAFKAATSSGQMEGSIDLTQAFGSLPGSVYLASVAYGTADAGVIGSQCPAGNGNNNLEPGEFLQFPIATMRDQNNDGLLDRLDPSLDFRVTSVSGSSESLDLTWSTVPGKSYEIQWSADFLTWQAVSGSSRTAASGSASQSITLSSGGAPQRFYRVRLLP